MMKKIKRGVLDLVDLELSLARKDHGQTFHSPHEGYGVLMEELNEAQVESRMADNCFGDLLYYVRTNDANMRQKILIDVESRAVSAACEFIQVAAMARKMRESEGAQA